MPSRRPEAVDNPELIAAVAAMARGSRFLAGRFATDDPALAAARAMARRRVIGNGLRELDRLLEIVTDELDGGKGGGRMPERLAQLRLRLGVPDPDGDRLRGFTRSRHCLFYNDGLVVRGDRRGGTVMTTGWYEGTALRRVEIGHRLEVSAAEVADACRFYDRLARCIVAQADVTTPAAPPSARPPRPASIRSGCPASA